MADLLWSALQYADLGYAVFPCVPGRKQPLTANGFHDATTSAEQIEAWWTRHPNANIAIPTAGLVVVDVDGPSNPWLADQPDKLAELATGVVASTPRGGRHYIFRAPTDKRFRCRTGQIASNVDLRADGGYILVAPSVVGGKSYTFAPGLELDRPRDRLPEPPPWLLERLEPAADANAPNVRATAPVSEGNKIPSGQRNTSLVRMAGTMRRVGMSTAEIMAALHQANNDRCAPPMSPAEVQNIAISVGRYEPDQIATAMTEDHWAQTFARGPDGELKFNAITSHELDESDYDLTYLVDGLLVRGQPGVIAGPKKTLKTNISIDLALSLSEGGLFLGKFDVKKPTRVGVMSGESGAATIQETARRIAASKSKGLREFDRAFWAFEVPQLDNALHIQALRRFIESYELEVLVLDPTYLMMLGLGDNAGNLFVVGSFLKSLGDLAQQTGCTPLLCHHLKKGIADPFEPAELENVAWAGFQEFVRQWILLNRRIRYDPDKGGHHELWMSVGGSAGHSGLWGLNFDEGTRQDVGGRTWEVEVITAKDAYAERDAAENDAVEEKKQQQKQSKRDKQRSAVLDFLRVHSEGETLRRIRDALGVGHAVIHEILADLIGEGEIETCTFQRNKRNENGYRVTIERAGTVV